MGGNLGQIGSLGGQAVGAYYGGTSGAQLGGQIGGTAGSLTDSLTQSTPAPSMPSAPDRKPQSSAKADQSNVEALVMSLPPELRESFMKSLGLG